jgi:hypothetical protein
MCVTAGTYDGFPVATVVRYGTLQASRESVDSFIGRGSSIVLSGCSPVPGVDCAVVAALTASLEEQVVADVVPTCTRKSPAVGQHSLASVFEHNRSR